jgi:polyhydroxyalkanoate synthesis regulator phasin
MAYYMTMAQYDLFKRTLEAGSNLSTITRNRAKEIVDEFIKEGSLRTEQAEKAIEEVLEKSREFASSVREMVRHELKKQIDQLELISKNDLSKVMERFGVKRSGRSASQSSSGARAAAKNTTKKAAAKKAPSKKSTAKKSSGTGAKKTAKKR